MVLMRIVDVFFAFPLVVLVLAIVAILGNGLLYLLIAMWAVTWVSYTRIVRAEVMIVKQQEYVTAARALGYSRWRIMARTHLAQRDRAGDRLRDDRCGRDRTSVSAPRWASLVSAFRIRPQSGAR